METKIKLIDLIKRGLTDEEVVSRWVMVNTLIPMRVKQKEEDLRKMRKLCLYPAYSSLLEESLISGNCPQDLLGVFDQMLWNCLSEVDLDITLTAEVIMRLDQWVSNSYFLEGFYPPLAVEMNNEFGIRFKGSRELIGDLYGSVS